MRRATRMMAVLLAALAGGAMLASGPQDDGVAGERTRFEYVDVIVDSGSLPLAAYQVEVSGAAGRVKIVGIEGGQHAAFGGAPYYDPEAMRHERVVIAAFSLGDDLPAGPTRVARVHVMVTGDGPAGFTASLAAGATRGAKKIEASVRLEQGEGQ